jgi:hypothetical protein
VPSDLQLSGAQFTFTAVSVLPFPFGETGQPTPLPAPVTCMTDAAGTCTVTGAFAVPDVSDGDSDLLLPFGSYVVTQTGTIPGLGSAPWTGGDLSICFIGCDVTKPIAATNPSLFRQQITATVIDDTGGVAAGAEYTLAGPDFPTGPVDPADAGPALPAVARSDSDGLLVFDGWFAPGDWDFTPTGTTPDGLRFLAETHELATTATEALDATPWDVSLLRTTGAGTGEGEGDDEGDDEGEGDGTGEGEGDTGGGDTDGAEEPGAEGPGSGPGRPVPGPGNPGTGNPVTPPVPTGAPAAPNQADDGVAAPAGPPVDDQPAGQAAPTTSAVPTTPSSGAATAPPSNRTAPSLPPEFVLTESSPQLQTVSFGLREAGFAAFGVVFLGAVFFGLLLFRRRSRRQR